ncbi:MAG: hypothetical protein ABI220_00740 [Candidatus Saccharimonadales bacterium]
MNNDQIDDLKQFIAATIRQQTTNTATKDDIATIIDKMATKDDIARLEHKVNDIQTSIGDALATSNDAVDERLVDHENRLTALETKPA